MQKHFREFVLTLHPNLNGCFFMLSTKQSKQESSSEEQLRHNQAIDFTKGLIEELLSSAESSGNSRRR